MLNEHQNYSRSLKKKKTSMPWPQPRPIKSESLPNQYDLIVVFLKAKDSWLTMY